MLEVLVLVEDELMVGERAYVHRRRSGA